MPKGHVDLELRPLSNEGLSHPLGSQPTKKGESGTVVEKELMLSCGTETTCSGRASVCPINLPLSVSLGKETRQNPARVGPRMYNMTNGSKFHKWWTGVDAATCHSNPFFMPESGITQTVGNGGGWLLQAESTPQELRSAEEDHLAQSHAFLS